MSVGLVTGVLVCLLLAFLLAAAESAVQRVSRASAQEHADEGHRGGAALVTVLSDSAGYLSSTTFLRVVLETTAAVLMTVAATRWFDAVGTVLAVSIGAMTVASFVVGGVSPRTLGRQHADGIALAAAGPVVWLRRVLGPVARLLVALGNAVTPGRGFRDGPFATEAELRDLVDLAGETSVIADDEREMIHSVFELGDTITREVMVPRTDMITIDADRTLRQAMSLFVRSGYSRIPVLGDDADDPRGLVYFKDVAERTHVDPDAASAPLTEVMRPAPFVPESKPVDALLREMQRDQAHMAIVVDEYGGTAGLVTIEDLIEEIVGEISDEHDREAPGVDDLGDGRMRVPASMSIDDFADLFDLDIDDDEVDAVDTVAGLLAMVSGRVPIVGSQGRIGDVVLTADRMAGRRRRIASVVAERVPAGDGVDATAAGGVDGAPSGAERRPRGAQPGDAPVTPGGEHSRPPEWAPTPTDRPEVTDATPAGPNHEPRSDESRQR